MKSAQRQGLSTAHASLQSRPLYRNAMLYLCTEHRRVKEGVSEGDSDRSKSTEKRDYTK